MMKRRELLMATLAASAGSVLAADPARAVTDMAGRKVVLPGRIERVVTLGSLPVINSFVFTMGEGRRIVNGLADFNKPHWKYQTVFAPQLAGQPTMQQPNREPNLEALLAAQEATLKPEWVTQNPMHGVMIQSGIPPKFRVCASMRRAPGTSRGSGNSFVAMDAVVSTLTVPQIDAVLNQWFQSPEGQAEIKATQEAFDAEVKALTAFAERTGK